MGPPQGWLVPGVWLGGLLPAVDLAASSALGTLGSDPVAEALNRSGLLALVLLLACLACTPARLVLRASWPVAMRRPLGLLAFGYAAAHGATYLALDRGLRLAAVVEDLTERPFVLSGAAALLTLLPLAATSSRRAIARLGARRWQALHRLVYLAGVLAVVHFVLRVKKDLSEPLAAGLVLAVLLGVRAVDRARRRRALAGNPPRSSVHHQDG